MDKPICPECGGDLDADFVDVGVGEQRVGPWRCDRCQWVEPEADNDVDYFDESPW